VKIYLVGTAVLFGLVVAAHVARVILEGPHVMRQPVFLLATLVAAVVCGWALVLLRRMRRGS